MMKTEHGYALAKQLRESADECASPDREQLLRAGADEIEALVEECKRLMFRVNNTEV